MERIRNTGIAVFIALLFISFAHYAHAACSNPTGAKGTIVYNSDAKTMQFCNDTNWIDMGAGSGSTGTLSNAPGCYDGFKIKWDAASASIKCVSADDLPDSFSFTALTGQDFSTLVTSNTVTPINYIGPLAVSVSGDGSPQISINGGAWASSGSITTGQTLQLRMTTSPDYDTTFTATVTVGAFSANWTTTTRGNCPVYGQKSNTLPAGCTYADNDCYVYSDIASVVKITSNFITTPSASDQGTFKWRVNGCDNRGSYACSNIDLTPYYGWGTTSITMIDWNGPSCIFSTPGADAVPGWGYSQACPGPDFFQQTTTRSCYRLMN